MEQVHRTLALVGVSLLLLVTLVWIAVNIYASLGDATFLLISVGIGIHIILLQYHEKRAMLRGTLLLILSALWTAYIFALCYVYALKMSFVFVHFTTGIAFLDQHGASINAAGVALLSVVMFYSSGNAVYLLFTSQRPLKCLLCQHEDMQDRIHGLCASCTHTYKDEIKRVRAQNARARLKGLPATLTLVEWIETVQSFHHRCAYCQKEPYQALDHFIPIVSGGGTTKENCFPACTSCNSSKSGKHPEQLAQQ